MNLFFTKINSLNKKINNNNNKETVEERIGKFCLSQRWLRGSFRRQFSVFLYFHVVAAQPFLLCQKYDLRQEASSTVVTPARSLSTVPLFSSISFRCVFPLSFSLLVLFLSLSYLWFWFNVSFLCFLGCYYLSFCYMIFG